MKERSPGGSGGRTLACPVPVVGLVLFAGAVLSGCDGASRGKPDALRRADPAAAGKVVTLVPFDAPAGATDGPALRVRVVWKNADRMRGLGGVAHLPPDEGMLFVYGKDELRSFWMKNCLIPLDIAYLRADGSIVNIVTLPAPDPGDAATGRAPGTPASAPSEGPCRFVLEANAGWFAAHGLGPGSLVLTENVVRGLDPEPTGH